MEKQKLNNTIRDIVGKSLDIQTKKVDAFGKYTQHCNENEMLREKYNVFNKFNADIENRLRDQREQVEKAKVRDVKYVLCILWFTVIFVQHRDSLSK